MPDLVTYADLVARCDERVLQELVSDTDTPVEDISTDARIQSALRSGLGRVYAAMLPAKLYTVEQLETLATATDATPAGRAAVFSLVLLKDIVCQQALAKLLRRRPEKYNDEAITALKEESEDYLDRLRHGERLFAIVGGEHPDAGLPSVGGPSRLDYQRLNMIPDRTKNFYPSRGRRLPLGR